MPEKASDPATGTEGSEEGAPGPETSEQEQLIAEHESLRGPLPTRILAELRSGAAQGGAKALGAISQGADALRLEVVETGLTGNRALVGHALGMRLLIPAEGVHGPRETAVLLYLFADGIAIRPTDDSPMSAVPLYGLHIVMPHVAAARWIYKAGRTAHANMNLEEEDRRVEGELAEWTIDDFRRSDQKLQVYMSPDLATPLYVYEHLGFVRVTFGARGGAQVRLKSALPESPEAYVRLWELFSKALGPGRVTMEQPSDDRGGVTGP